MFLLALFVSCIPGPTTACGVLTLKVIDADTVTVLLDSASSSTHLSAITSFYNVRLRGIDAPELHSKNRCEREKAQTAKLFVEKIINSATQVDLYSVSRDKYFRLLADVVVDGTSVSARLLKAHLAVPYFGETKPKVNWCQGK